MNYLNVHIIVKTTHRNFLIDLKSKWEDFLLYVVPRSVDKKNFYIVIQEQSSV